MLASDARIHERSREKESEALHSVAMAMLQYTPMVALEEEAVVLMDVGASLRLFKGVRNLRRLIRADLQSLGFTGRVSCAPNARAAWLMARCGGGQALKQASMIQRLGRLPALAVPAARQFSDWLQGLGCESIAELRRLPRPGLQRRCGRALLDTLDAAFGEAPELFEWIEAPDAFRATIELFDRIESAELLLAGAQRLVVQMSGWLSAKQLAAESVSLFLQHERRRTARPPTEVQVVLAEPTWKGDHIIRLLKERLAKLELEAPVHEIALEAVKLQPMAPPDGDLFPEKGGTEQDQRRVLELLIARLGVECVQEARPVADHRPEVANGWTPIQEAMAGPTRTAQLPPDVHLKLWPTWLLPKPIPLLLRANRPFYGSPLRIVSGPERIEAGWWSDGATRDYFVAQGEADNALYWIYSERIASTKEGEDPKFFLHGLFG